MKKKLIMIVAMLIVIGVAVCGCSKAPATSSQKENANDGSKEENPAEYQFDATVLEIHEDYLMVEALEGQTVAGEIQVWIGLLEDNDVPELKTGDTIRITHDGKMTMSLPPQMSAVEPIEIIE